MDLFQELRRAVGAIIDGDDVPSVGLQAIIGRASDLITTWESLDLHRPLPVITYLIIAFPQRGNSGDTRRGAVQFDAWADEETGGVEKTEAILERIEQLISADRFDAASPSVNAAPILLTRRYPPADAERSRGIARATLDIELEIKR